jgi:hypothetical protein
MEPLVPKKRKKRLQFAGGVDSVVVVKTPKRVSLSALLRALAIIQDINEEARLCCLVGVSGQGHLAYVLASIDIFWFWMDAQVLATVKWLRLVLVYFGLIFFSS